MENQEINEVAAPETEQKAPMIKITFSRKLAKPFTSKSGKEMATISIPNTDPEDKRPWEEFVLPVQMLHSDHYGSKTLWTRLPEDGSTTLSRPVKPEIEGGAWTREERIVDNKTLKSMVEAYKLKPKTQGSR